MRALLTGLALLLLALPAYAEIDGPGDFQVWSSFSLEDEINEWMRGRIHMELRWGNNATTLYVQFMQGELYFKVRPWLDIAPGFRQLRVLARVKRNRWREISQPYIDFNPSTEIEGWKIKNRNRLEYRIPYRRGGNRWIYRFRIQLRSPWKLTCLEFSPWWDNEVFYRITEKFTQNRMRFGVNFKLIEPLIGSVYYMWRLNRGTYQNILGLWVHAAF